jgi:hypothetical protein
MLNVNKAYKIKKITMSEYYDADGNLVEGLFTADELTAKIEEAKASFTPPPADPVPPVTPVATTDNEPPEWFKPFAAKVDQLAGNQKETVISSIAAAVDAEKRVNFNTNFNNLLGYAETPEGMQERAKAAYLLTTGQQYNDGAINMQNIDASKGGPTKPTAPPAAVDEGFKKTFGITDEDITKYGNK